MNARYLAAPVSSRAGERERYRGTTVRFVAIVNGDTLKELGREAAMGGVEAPSGLPSACEEAAAKGDGATGIELWDVVLVVNQSLGDSEIKPVPIDDSRRCRPI
jgi:hypothetical protein